MQLTFLFQRRCYDDHACSGYHPRPQHGRPCFDDDRQACSCRTQRCHCGGRSRCFGWRRRGLCRSLSDLMAYFLLIKLFIQVLFD